MQIAIIGGGAAGMMASLQAAIHNPQAQVTLFERNDTLGKKVMISGGGRCNVTTGTTELTTVLAQYPRGRNFLRHAFNQLSPQKLISWIEAQGVPLKIEADLRVFPQSDNGADFVKMFNHLLQKYNVKIKYRAIVKKVSKANNQFCIEYQQNKSLHQLHCAAIIITTGGKAYRHTGSLGDGYDFAEQLGHTITPLSPSLNSYICQETFYNNLAGLSFPRAKLRFYNEQNKPLYEFIGPCIFTHKGISGPGVFALSALASHETVTATEPKKITIDFFPDQSEDVLRTKLQNQIQLYRKRNISTSLQTIVSKRLAYVLLEQIQTDPNKKNSEISKKSINKLIDLLKNFPVTAIKKTPGDEFVTAGGVSRNEIDPQTMESKITPKLYFAGEIIDIDGFTGGYNLHAAWATGALAGTSAATSD